MAHPNGIWLALAVLSCSSLVPARGLPAGNPLRALGVEEIVFAARVSGRDHYYVNFGYYVNRPERRGYGDGGRLCRLNLSTGELTVLLDDPKGGVRDPQVHYDGGKILFSYRKGGQPYYHLYEINADGTGLRQLTDGPWDDVEPTYLPDGDIIFCSSRCHRWVGCWYTQVAILYRCDPDGRNVRMISSSAVHDDTPAVLPDGRVLYTRWEYVDRSRVRYHHLWTINPDGTGQMAYFGNMHGGTVMIDARPVPGTHKVVASFSPGHGQTEHQGRITIIDPKGGPDERHFARPISRDSNLHDPYPLSEDCFLVARRREILVLNGRGALRPIYELPAADRHLECHEPRPLRPRARERCLSPRANPAETTGRLILADVTHGRRTAGVRRGEIRKLLVLEQLPKPVNFSGTMEPISIGGTFTLKRILGTVPVEPDGSAFAELPALRSLFFVALDEQDLAVKRMQSFVTIQPGETTSCAGCHENRTETSPRRSNLLAARRPPSRLQPIPDVPDVIDFPRDVQPILDKHCLECHGHGRRKGGVILSGDRGPWYSQSYCTLLTARGLVSHGRDADGNKPPRGIGTSASRLMRKIDRAGVPRLVPPGAPASTGGPGGEAHPVVKLSPREHRMIRLWIETGATYPGTYAALGTGMVRVSLPQDPLVRRCSPCHNREKRRGRRPSIRFRHPDDLLFNLSRPARSLVLTAPLAAEAGGYGLCKGKIRAPLAVLPPPRLDPDLGPREIAQKPAEVAAVFAGTKDPDYRKLLDAVGKAKEQLDRIRRFDMPGFRPNVHYLREMKRYGVLSAALGPDDPIDVYATDETYWRLFWYRPATR